MFGKALTGRVDILAGWAGRRSAPRRPPPRSSRRKPPAHPDTSQKRKRAGQHDSLSGPISGHPAGQPPRPESRPRSKISPSIPLRVHSNLYATRPSASAIPQHTLESRRSWPSPPPARCPFPPLDLTKISASDGRLPCLFVFSPRTRRGTPESIADDCDDDHTTTTTTTTTTTAIDSRPCRFSASSVDHRERLAEATTDSSPSTPACSPNCSGAKTATRPTLASLADSSG